MVDSVGSHTLANACASTRYGGAVAACGLAQGMDFPGQRGAVHPARRDAVRHRQRDGAAGRGAPRSLGAPGARPRPGQARAITREIGLAEAVAAAREHPGRAGARPAGGRTSTVDAAGMNIVCIGGGPAGLYFALLMKKLGPAHDIASSSATSPTTPSAGAWCSPTPTMDNMRAVGPRQTADEIEAASTTGTTSSCTSRAAASAAAATASSASAARSCSTSCRRAARRWACELVFETDAEQRRRLPRRRPRSSPATASTRASAASYAEVFKPDVVTRPNRFIWLGTTQAVRRLHLPVRADRARLVPGPRLQVRRPDQRPSSSRCPEDVWQAHGLDRADADDSHRLLRDACSPSTCRAEAA